MIDLKHSGLRALLAAGTLAAAGAAQATHIYIPFSDQNSTTGSDVGLWLADVANLGNPPVQLTNQVLDGPANTVAILDDWTLDPVSHLATNVQPKAVVYGVGGHLYKGDLATANIGPVTQFSNGNYGELCSLTALDERPFAASKAYVQAVIEPVGSVNSCASGIGTQVWLIAANASAASAPTLEPSNWSVLGAFTDPTDGSFVRWVVWTGNQVVAYKANFTGGTSLLVGPPAGPAPRAVSRTDSTMFISAGSDAAGVHTDQIYRVTMTGSSAVGNFSYADGSVCSSGVTTTGTFTASLADAATGLMVFSEPTSSGYAVFTVPLAGGAVTQIHADSTGTECGALGGDGPSAGFVGLNEVDMGTGEQHAIGLNETGPGNQTPVFLAGGAGFNAFIHYTVDGHLWIDVDSDVSPSFTEVVMDANGTPIQSYANSLVSNDTWAGFSVGGAAPSIQRNTLLLFSPNGTLGSCSGGTLTAVDPSAFTTTNVSGLPADTCRAQAFGWLPAAVGYLKEPAGASPIEVDPVRGNANFLLGPDPSGIFLNLGVLGGYPFF